MTSLQNILVEFIQELDDERDREEKKKKKKAAKRRDKNKRKKNKDGDKIDGKMNGILGNHVDEFDELDEEETKGDFFLLSKVSAIFENFLVHCSLFVFS